MGSGKSDVPEQYSTGRRVLRTEPYRTSTCRKRERAEDPAQVTDPERAVKKHLLTVFFCAWRCAKSLGYKESKRRSFPALKELTVQRGDGIPEEGGILVGQLQALLDKKPKSAPLCHRAPSSASGVVQTEVGQWCFEANFGGRARGGPALGSPAQFVSAGRGVHEDHAALPASHPGLRRYSGSGRTFLPQSVQVLGCTPSRRGLAHGDFGVRPCPRAGEAGGPPRRGGGRGPAGEGPASRSARREGGRRRGRRAPPAGLARVPCPALPPPPPAAPPPAPSRMSQAFPRDRERERRQPEPEPERPRGGQSSAPGPAPARPGRRSMDKAAGEGAGSGGSSRSSSRATSAGSSPSGSWAARGAGGRRLEGGSHSSPGSVAASPCGAGGRRREPALEGVLSKYTNLLQGWQNRYFMLDFESGILQYFVNEQSKSQKPRGALSLAGAIVSLSDEAPHMLVVYSANGEVYKLRAADAKEKQCWVTQLQNCAKYHMEAHSKSPPSSRSRSLTLLPHGTSNSSSPSSQRHLTPAPPTVVTVTHHKSPAAARRSKSHYSAQLHDVREMMNQVEGQQKTLVRAIEALPCSGPLTALDQDLLLLKATSAATLSCLGECLSLLQQSIHQVGQYSHRTGPSVHHRMTESQHFRVGRDLSGHSDQESSPQRARPATQPLPEDLP
ncbi:uncharacterized protein LOC144454166 [Phascolarctos cinereus]